MRIFHSSSNRPDSSISNRNRGFGGRVISDTEFRQPKAAYSQDLLEEVSYTLYELKKENGMSDYYDFKHWDYPG